jgi:hypothetical protein
MQKQRGELFKTFRTGREVAKSQDTERELALTQGTRTLEPERPRRRRPTKRTIMLRREIVRVMHDNMDRDEALDLLASLARRKGRAAPGDGVDLNASVPSVLDEWYSARELERVLQQLGAPIPPPPARPKRAKKKAPDGGFPAPAATKSLRRQIVRALQDLPRDTALALLTRLATLKQRSPPSGNADPGAFAGALFARGFTAAELIDVARHLGISVRDKHR